MTLPILNSDPKYNTTIPSTGQPISFRPYLVKEEKVLLLAMESEDSVQILRAVSDTIHACIQEKIDPNTLTSFDIEFLFVKIRSKSVGETQTFGMVCTECDMQNEVTVNLENLSIDVPKDQKTIQVDDDTVLEMKWPSYKELTESGIGDMKTSEQLFSIIRCCMDAIQFKDSRIEFKEYKIPEIDKFIESMNSGQFAKVRDFVESMPGLKHTVEFECTKCQHKNTHVLEGMQSFFA